MSIQMILLPVFVLVALTFWAPVRDGGYAAGRGHERLLAQAQRRRAGDARERGHAEDAQRPDRVQLPRPQALREGQRLRVEVTDWGPGFTRGARPSRPADAVGGWGLVLVERLADRWGVMRNSFTRVWFEIDLGRRRRAAI